MTIKFLGRGGAFAPMSIGNSNMMLTSESGKRMMFDFGSTAPYIYRDEWKLDFGDIDAVYISHLHADHCNLEMFAFHRYFLPKIVNGFPEKPKLYMVKSLMEEMWENTLRGGLESLQGKIMNLTDYFDCRPVCVNGSFDWEGYNFTPIQTVHVRSGYIIKHSYGLAIRKIQIAENGERYIEQDKYDAYITSDTQFDRGLNEYYNRAKMIFHDCETGAHKSIVHSHYDDLKGLKDDVKKKMWLYHYNNKVDSFKEDGFAGFVEKGQEFEF
jgi:ribonuclease BN (tRNA processing enzyme)